MQEITMSYIVRMNEFDAPESLPEPFSDRVFVESVGKTLEIVKNCAIDELKDEVKTFLSMKHFKQVH